MAAVPSDTQKVTIGSPRHIPHGSVADAIFSPYRRTLDFKPMDWAFALGNQHLRQRSMSAKMVAEGQARGNLENCR